MNDPPDATTPRVAVAIPCHDEAAAIAAVVAEWRAALPDAEIVVFDNNSTDGTGRMARALGVRVVDVPEQGKGHAVRAIFEVLRDRDAVVLVDGDGTYPASHVGGLLTPVLAGEADMTVGARRPEARAGAMTPIRGFGNVVIRAAFRLLVGAGTGDLLSGYRVFGPNFLRGFTPRSRGFEVETELASEAVARRMRVVERPVPYRPRIAGTVSKLRAFRDGRRILVTIVVQGARLRPWRLAAVLAVAALALLVSLAVGAAVLRAKSGPDRWRARSKAFRSQVNTLGKTLGPGDVGVVRVSASDADELILLPAFCPQEVLVRHFPGRPVSLVDALWTLSRDDRLCPALVWIRGGSVVSINRAGFTTGVDNTFPLSWQVRDGCDIGVVKEWRSANPFLSLVFVRPGDVVPHD